MKKISFPSYVKAPDFSYAIYKSKNKIENAEVSGLIQISPDGANSLEKEYTQSLTLRKLVDTIYDFRSTAEELAKLLDADPKWLERIESHHESTLSPFQK